MIYLASPYSHPLEEIRQYRWSVVLKVAARLMKEGHHVFSPIVHCHDMARFFDMPTDHKFWQTYDEHMISKADALWVLRMEGWDKSNGVASEIGFAQLHQIPVHFIDE